LHWGNGGAGGSGQREETNHLFVRRLGPVRVTVPVSRIRKLRESYFQLLPSSPSFQEVKCVCPFTRLHTQTVHILWTVTGQDTEYILIKPLNYFLFIFLNFF